jgi:hypothetical protein
MLVGKKKMDEALCSTDRVIGWGNGCHLVSVASVLEVEVLDLFCDLNEKGV